MQGATCGWVAGGGIRVVAEGSSGWQGVAAGAVGGDMLHLAGDSLCASCNPLKYDLANFDHTRCHCHECHVCVFSSLMQYTSLPFSPVSVKLESNNGAVTVFQKFYENIDIDSTSSDEKLTRPGALHFYNDFP